MADETDELGGGRGGVAPVDFFVALFGPGHQPFRPVAQTSHELIGLVQAIADAGGELVTGNEHLAAHLFTIIVFMRKHNVVCWNGLTLLYSYVQTVIATFSEGVIKIGM